MHAYYNRLTGHLGCDKTIRKVLDRFYWPGAWTWIEQYVKGCTTYQQNKNLIHQTQIPLYKITVPSNALPFTQVAMDLITGLPKSQGYNSILTIIDHGCSLSHSYPWIKLKTLFLSNLCIWSLINGFAFFLSYLWSLIDGHTFDQLIDGYLLN